MEWEFTSFLECKNSYGEKRECFKKFDEFDDSKNWWNLTKKIEKMFNDIKKKLNEENKKFRLNFIDSST